MKKLLSIVVLLMFITSCIKDAKETVNSDNSNFHVEKLFNVDSITVYRFEDNGAYHYFTKDWTISRVNCGKNCTRDEYIPNN